MKTILLQILLATSAMAQLPLETPENRDAVVNALGLVIGTNVQAYDADLTTWAGIAPASKADDSAVVHDTGDESIAGAKTFTGSAIIGGGGIMNVNSGATFRTFSGATITLDNNGDWRTALGLVIGTNVQAYDADLTSWAGIAPASKADAAIYTEKHSTSHTISAAECYGGVHYVTAAGTITLPPAAAGMSVTIITIGNVAASVDPDAADLIMLDGVALSDGDKITNASTAGDIAVLSYYDATGWHASTNSWTDGN